LIVAFVKYYYSFIQSHYTKITIIYRATILDVGFTFELLYKCHYSQSALMMIFFSEDEIQHVHVALELPYMTYDFFNNKMCVLAHPVPIINTTKRYDHDNARC